MSTGSAASKVESDPQQLALYVATPLDIWSNQAQALVRKTFPQLKIIEIDPASGGFDQVGEGSELSVVFSEASSKKGLEQSLKIIRALGEKIGNKSVSVALVTFSGANAVIEQLEKNNLVQLLSPTTSPKALKVKIEFIFSKMRAAKEALNVKEQKDYLIKSEEPASGKDKVINLTQAKGKELSAETSPPLAAREWGKGSGIQPIEKKTRELKSPVVVSSEVASVLSIVDGVEFCPINLPKNRRVVLISPRDQDLTFAVEISIRTKSSFHYFHRADDELQSFLSRNPDSIVFWDIDHDEASESRSSHSVENIGLALSKYISPMQIFAISNQNINCLPYIFNYQKHVFSHCFFRTENPTALEVYSRVVDRMMGHDPFDIRRYFGEKSRSQKIDISKGIHRIAAVTATERFLAKCGLSPRLAGHAARAADELILNAIHDAPVDSAGRHYRWGLEQPANYQFAERERIALSVYQNDEFYAISVRDLFGSLSPELVLKSLQKNFMKESAEQGMGIGLNSVVGMGFSLLVAVKPKEATEVSIFFPNTANYRNFRRLFRFLSVTTVSNPADEAPEYEEEEG